MSDTEERERKLSEFAERVSSQIEDVLQDAMEVCEVYDDAEFLQAVYEIWGRNMGMLDAVSCLRGVALATRQRSMRNQFLSAKQEVLETHRRSCKACPQSDLLLAEIEGLH